MHESLSKKSQFSRYLMHRQGSASSVAPRSFGGGNIVDSLEAEASGLPILIRGAYRFIVSRNIFLDVTPHWMYTSSGELYISSARIPYAIAKS